FAATLASVCSDTPWSCMYLLIFIAKNFVVMNCPNSPYHDGHAYRRGSALNAPGKCLSMPTAMPISCLPDWMGRPASGGPAGARRTAVVQMGERDPGQAEQRDDCVGVVDFVATAEGELNVAPLDAGVGKGPANRDRAHVDTRDAGKPTERVEPDADDRNVHH